MFAGLFAARFLVTGAAITLIAVIVAGILAKTRIDPVGHLNALNASNAVVQVGAVASRDATPAPASTPQTFTRTIGSMPAALQLTGSTISVNVGTGQTLRGYQSRLGSRAPAPASTTAMSSAVTPTPTPP